MWRIYSEANGALLSEETYVDNLLHGLVKVYYPDTGATAEETNYQNGQKQGSARRFFPSGQLQSETSYSNDLPDGVFVAYFVNGQKQTEGLFIHGLKSGTWRIWDEQGNLISEEVHQEQ